MVDVNLSELITAVCATKPSLYQRVNQVRSTVSWDTIGPVSMFKMQFSLFFFSDSSTEHFVWLQHSINEGLKRGPSENMHLLSVRVVYAITKQVAILTSPCPLATEDRRISLLKIRIEHQLHVSYRWPLNKIALNCAGPLIHGFFSIWYLVFILLIFKLAKCGEKSVFS